MALLARHRVPTGSCRPCLPRTRSSRSISHTAPAYFHVRATLAASQTALNNAQTATNGALMTTSLILEGLGEDVVTAQDLEAYSACLATRSGEATFSFSLSLQSAGNASAYSPAATNTSSSPPPASRRSVLAGGQPTPRVASGAGAFAAPGTVPGTPVDRPCPAWMHRLPHGARQVAITTLQLTVWALEPWVARWAPELRHCTLGPTVAVRRPKHQLGVTGEEDGAGVESPHPVHRILQASSSGTNGSRPGAADGDDDPDTVVNRVGGGFFYNSFGGYSIPSGGVSLSSLS